MEINLSKDYKEQEQTPLGFEEPEEPAAGFEYEVSRDDGNAFCHTMRSGVEWCCVLSSLRS